jgi:hypothetical protein
MILIEGIEAPLSVECGHEAFFWELMQKGLIWERWMKDNKSFSLLDPRIQQHDLMYQS